jgi:hypothetical protein
MNSVCLLQMDHNVSTYRYNVLIHVLDPIQLNSATFLLTLTSPTSKILHLLLRASPHLPRPLPRPLPSCPPLIRRTLRTALLLLRRQRRRNPIVCPRNSLLSLLGIRLRQIPLSKGGDFLVLGGDFFFDLRANVFSSGVGHGGGF